jgi:hypothetical protein
MGQKRMSTGYWWWGSEAKGNTWKTYVMMGYDIKMDV